MRPISPLLQLSLLVAALAALPVASIAFYLLAGGTGATWQHLVDTVLETQRTLLSTQESVATTTAAVAADHVRLYKALGGGWAVAE